MDKFDLRPRCDLILGEFWVLGMAVADRAGFGRFRDRVAMVEFWGTSCISTSRSTGEEVATELAEVFAW